MDTKVYVEQPEGYEETPTGVPQSEHKNYVCELKKAVYGTKQASRLSNQDLVRHLKNFGCKASTGDN